MTLSPRLLVLPAAVLGLVLGVYLAFRPDPADVAAKARIFSAEDPAPDRQRAAERIDVGAAATNPEVWKRVLRMDRLEASRRIGPHRLSSSVQWKWTRPGRTVELFEESRFETDADLDFHLTMTNTEEAGLEFIWAQGRAYARSRYGAFRARRTDRAQQDTWRDEGTGAMRTLYDLLDRRLRATAAGPARHADRAAQKFTLTLGDAWGDPPPVSTAPPSVFGLVRREKEALSTGPDDDTQLRLDFDALRRPESLTGELLVDESTGVVLKAKARAKFSVKRKDDAAPAILDAIITFDVFPDTRLAVEAPANVVAPRLPHAVNDPLWFLSEKGAPAGEPARAADPEDEEVEPETTKAPAKPQ